MSCDPWVMTATGSPATFDESEVSRAAALLLVGSRHEIRALPSGKHRYVAGGDADGLVAALGELAGNHAFYWTINEVDPSRDGSANTESILRRLWFFIDVDPKKPDPDVSATDAEKQAAAEVMWAIDERLCGLGWPAPVTIDSGNGFYLMYRCDLPNDKITKALFAKALKAIADHHGAERAKIDTVVHDAPRIARMPGTLNRKGAASLERPHRMCRVAHVPGAVGLLTTDNLKAVIAAGKPKAEPKADAPDPFVVTAGTSRLATYLERAKQGELMKVATAAAGDRNNQLNRSAFALGTLVPHGLPKFEVLSDLKAAARQCGLADREIDQTLLRAVEDGEGQPRDLPADVRPGAPLVTTPDGKPARLTIGAHEVEPKTVEWLWKDRIALNFISLFAGQTGQGKSFVTCDIAARLSRGDDLPESGPRGGECLRTLFISEDPYDYVLAPRLIELGADMTQIRFMTWEAMSAYSLARTDMLDAAFAECGEPSLLVIDPPTNFLSAKDEHKNTEVRQVLMKLVTWLQSHRAACVLITHLNKPGKGTDAISRIVGSIAWATTCRVACQFYPDPDDEDRSLMASPKNNLGPRAQTLAYRIKSTDRLATVEWLGVVDITAEQANSGEKRKPRHVVASEWLAEQFAKQREWSSDEIRRAAAEAGISKNALWDAKSNLPIKARQVITAAGDRGWTWFAEPGWPPQVPDGNLQRESADNCKTPF